MCANVMSLANDAASAIAIQAASPVTAGFPSAATDTASLNTLVPSLKTDLNTWYTAWRGKEPIEPPEAGFLGVFGTSTNFSAALGAVTPMMRMVRNDYVYAGSLAMAYEQLYSVGLALKVTAPGLDALAMTGLESIIPVVRSLSETMCRVTIRDLHNQDGSIGMSIATDAVTDTQAAWSA
ncbi:hypothetical protein BSZ36_05880 [Rubricoccus marinus]|uniref:Uncharacterized protein n=2 Tax=Rubricoccus marinus TaxID=716817 RepID=A0A259TXX6_9BACT|nr:hypothetical protein BSZ36_05880 [Rubricoccus marinus]